MNMELVKFDLKDCECKLDMNKNKLKWEFNYKFNEGKEVISDCEDDSK